MLCSYLLQYFLSDTQDPSCNIVSEVQFRCSTTFWAVAGGSQVELLHLSYSNLFQYQNTEWNVMENIARHCQIPTISLVNWEESSTFLSYFCNPFIFTSKTSVAHSSRAIQWPYKRCQWYSKVRYSSFVVSGFFIVVLFSVTVSILLWSSWNSDKRTLTCVLMFSRELNDLCHFHFCNWCVDGGSKQYTALKFLGDNFTISRTA